MNLFEYAAQRANKDGLCFIHPEGKEAKYAMLTLERYESLIQRIFGDYGIPVNDPEWLHDHAEPEMLEDLK